MNRKNYPGNAKIVQQIFCLTIAFTLLACASSSSSLQNWAVYQQLSGEEIKLAFNNVRDQAEVQDALVTTAENQWHADGRFISIWNNQQQSGKVTGRWFVQQDTRCVIIETGLPSMTNQTKCGPIFERNEKYYTVNEDGSIHGIHTLSELP